MDIDIDYKKGILFIRIIGNFIRSNISGDYKGLIVWNYNDSTGME